MYQPVCVREGGGGGGGGGGRHSVSKVVWGCKIMTILYYDKQYILITAVEQTSFSMGIHIIISTNSVHLFIYGPNSRQR